MKKYLKKPKPDSSTCFSVIIFSPIQKIIFLKKTSKSM
ncbi:hypothetical protein PHEL49_1292 [Polaribacter sp. Hel1_33_49]|nr:hypothetical protein PHEL49_1292 [Polaribacter sp. Hel1_33_49]